jgi:hypothetical protein
MFRIFELFTTIFRRRYHEDSNHKNICGPNSNFVTHGHWTVWHKIRVCQQYNKCATSAVILVIDKILLRSENLHLLFLAFSSHKTRYCAVCCVCLGPKCVREPLSQNTVLCIPLYWPAVRVNIFSSEEIWSLDRNIPMAMALVTVEPFKCSDFCRKHLVIWEINFELLDDWINFRLHKDSEVSCLHSVVSTACVNICTILTSCKPHTCLFVTGEPNTSVILPVTLHR